MKPIEKAIQNLGHPSEKIKILSLMQIQASSDGAVNSAASFSELLKTLDTLQSAGSHDVRYLSQKLKHRFQSMFHEKNTVITGAELSKDPRQAWESIKRLREPLKISRALKELPDILNHNDLQTILLFFEHSDYRVRAAASEWSFRHPQKELIPYLLTLLEDHSNRVKANTILSLHKMGEEVREPLRQMLANTSLAHRESGFWCLSKISADSWYLPWIIAGIEDPYPSIVSRCIFLHRFYPQKELEDKIESLFFSTKSKSLRNDIRKLWKMTGIPKTALKRLCEQKIANHLKSLGKTIFEELEDCTPSDPRLQAGYFLIIRQKDTLEIRICDPENPESQENCFVIPGLEEKLGNAFIALGKTALDLHKNQEFFFEQCETISPELEKLFHLLSLESQT